MKKGVLYTAGSIVILILCLIAFVLPSSLGRAANQKGIEFGSYNGKKIAYESGSDFSDFVSNYAEMFRMQGIQIDSSTQFSLFSYAFNSTVMKYAYEDAVKEAGWSVSKEAVNRRLRPYFNDANGKFSSKIYNQADPKQVETLRKDIEDSLYSSRYYDDNFGSSSEQIAGVSLFGLKESDAEAEFLAAYDSEKRGFNMAAFKKADYPESEKMDYASKNKAKFVKYDFSVITVDDKAAADKIAKRIEKGDVTFEDAILESEKTYSNSDGKLTNSFQYQLENMLADKADLDQLAKLSVGSVSPVIQTLSGYSIFKADSEAVQPDFTSEDMKSRLTSYINSYESNIIEDYYIAQANFFATEAKAKGFDAACESMGVEKTEIEPFPLNFGNISIASMIKTSLPGLSGADENENFLKAAFSLKLNEYSTPVVMNDYVVVVQYTNSETDTPEETPDFSDDIADYDNSSAQTSIMSSKKLKNNFISTYYSNLM